MKEESLVTFEIRIEGHKNHTWQGKVVTADGESAAFRSDLELLMTIDSLLYKNDKKTVFQWTAPPGQKEETK